MFVFPKGWPKAILLRPELQLFEKVGTKNSLACKQYHYGGYKKCSDTSNIMTSFNLLLGEDLFIL
jgi:hypothetical protein